MRVKDLSYQLQAESSEASPKSGPQEGTQRAEGPGAGSGPAGFSESGLVWGPLRGWGPGLVVPDGR